MDAWAGSRGLLDHHSAHPHPLVRVDSTRGLPHPLLLLGGVSESPWGVGREVSEPGQVPLGHCLHGLGASPCLVLCRAPRQQGAYVVSPLSHVTGEGGKHREATWFALSQKGSGQGVLPSADPSVAPSTAPPGHSGTSAHPSAHVQRGRGREQAQDCHGLRRLGCSSGFLPGHTLAWCLPDLPELLPGQGTKAGPQDLARSSPALCSVSGLFR